MLLHSRIVGEGNNIIVILHGLFGSGDNWKTYAKKFFILSVKIAKNSGKNILVVSPIMTVFSLATLYITVIHFNLSISEVAIFIRTAE